MTALARLRLGWQAWRGARAFHALPEAARTYVFYAEDAASWAHLGPLVEELIARGAAPCYLTSDPADPRLCGPRLYDPSLTDPSLADPRLADPGSAAPSRWEGTVGDGPCATRGRAARQGAADPGLRAFYIGAGAARTALFAGLRATVMTMTMPDLERFHLKRSRAQPVHYAYVFHSLVSTHRIYRPGAFDHYDTVLCAGPHHERELALRAAQRGVTSQRLVSHGYGRLDALCAAQEEARPDDEPLDGLRASTRAIATAPIATTPRATAPTHVLVAPSWGPQGLFEGPHAAPLIDALARAGLRLTLRPHPMTRRHAAEKLATLSRRWAASPLVRWESDVAESASLFEADLLLSDWSGAALEFAFARLRPVLFVDVPPKVNNPEHASFDCVPVEESLRPCLGEMLGLDEIDTAPARVAALLARGAAQRDAIRTARAETVHHLGESARIGADVLESIARDAVRPRQHGTSARGGAR